MNFLKKNIIFIIVCSLTLLGSLYLVYLDWDKHSKIAEANINIEENKQKIDSAYKSKLRPVDPNVKMISSDTEIVKQRTNALQRIFGKPYRKGLIAFAKALNMSEEELIARFKELYSNESQKDKSPDTLIPLFKKQLGDKVKVDAAFNLFVDEVQKNTVENLRGSSSNDIFAVALGVPRNMNSSSCHVLLATMQQAILDRRNIPGVSNLDTVRAFTYNQYIQTPPPLSKIPEILKMMPIFEDIFYRMRISGINALVSFQKMNDGVAYSDKFIKYSFRVKVTGPIDSIRKLVNILHEAYQDNRVYVVNWIALTSDTEAEVADARALITDNDQPSRSSRQENVSQPNLNLPLEERPDYGRVIIGNRKDITADIEFDYYVFTGDQLDKQS